MYLKKGGFFNLLFSTTNEQRLKPIRYVYQKNWQIHFRRKVMILNIIHKTAITDANNTTSLNRFSITQIKNLRLESQKKQDEFHASLKN